METLIFPGKIKVWYKFMQFKESIEPNIENLSSKENNVSTDHTDQILCHHCLRTRIKPKLCLGICVADSEY